eukprot:2813143-Rhodomonas_salina.1
MARGRRGSTSVNLALPCLVSTVRVPNSRGSIPLVVSKLKTRSDARSNPGSSALKIPEPVARPSVYGLHGVTSKDPTDAFAPRKSS